MTLVFKPTKPRSIIEKVDTREPSRLSNGLGPAAMSTLSLEVQWSLTVIEVAAVTGC